MVEPVKLQVSEHHMQAMVEDSIRVAVMEALNKDPEALVRSIVDMALRQKKNSWDKETVFQAQVREMIHEAATEEFRAWLQEHRNIIKDRVRAVMEGEFGPSFLDQLANRLVEAMATSFYVSVMIKDQ